MGAYQRFLWENISTFIESLPEDKKILAQTFQQESLSIAKQELLSTHHTVDARMAISIALLRFSCLRIAGLAEDTRARIEDIPFDGAGLSYAETDDMLENVQKKHSAARHWGVYPSYQQRPQQNQWKWPHNSY